ncbi:lytic transglycosylase domain-containing protein, partial [Candidatus Sumerlaeota bacterium]|nr:lytic transglycosylase domain-containing protein [Candidatus Sumerlaeota bacterium]
MVATYTQTEETCLSALEEEKRIIDEFDSLAMSAIGEASAKLNIAEGFFSRMEEIFTALGPGPNAADDVALRNRRESLREELRARVLNANVELGVSTLKREDKVFHEAIEIARDIQEQAEEVTQETYRVVAENAIQGVGNELTRYERGGGREYAPEETSRAEAMLVQTRQLVEEGQYREASELAAATKAQVEILAQELERVYQSKVEDAGKSRELARAYGAGTYEEDRLRQVDLLLREAEGRLDAEALDEAIQLAEEAALVAGDAGDEALRQWALDEIRRTDITLARALEAGADGYAPALVDEAINLRRSAENLIQAGNLVEGQSLASQAAQTIENALYAEVIQGEEEVALAMRYEGWKYETDRLLSDPAYNARLGSAYLADLVDEFDGYYPFVAVGYNAGPSRAKKWVDLFGDPKRSVEDAVDWIEHIP